MVEITLSSTATQIARCPKIEFDPLYNRRKEIRLMPTKVSKTVSATHTRATALEDELPEELPITDPPIDLPEDLGPEPIITLPAIDPRLIPPLGFTPTRINQIVPGNLGGLTTQFQGPIVSGQIGMGTVPGLALLSLPILIDYSMGNFSIPIQFPSQSMLLWAVTMVYNSFSGATVPTDTTFQLGTANGRNDILTADGMGPIHTTDIHPVTGTLPFAVDPNPFQAWLTVNNQGNTAGSGLLLLIFARLGRLAWS